jgi:hypothetical protein
MVPVVPVDRRLFVSSSESATATRSCVRSDHDVPTSSASAPDMAALARWPS